MSRGPCSAVFFDVGNTLLFPYPSVSRVCEEILRAAGHERDLGAIEELMPLVDEYYEDRFRADDTFWTSEEATSGVWVGMYSLLCRRLGIEDGAEDLARAVYDEFGRPDRWRAYDDVAPTFRRMHELGAKVGLVSNWDCRLEGLFEGLGLTPLIDTIVSSAAVTSPTRASSNSRAHASTSHRASASTWATTSIRMFSARGLPVCAQS
jgi:FMN phosphatase YigB (HAD superfamily)